MSEIADAGRVVAEPGFDAALSFPEVSIALTT
jgi:hypothetical protein